VFGVVTRLAAPRVLRDPASTTDRAACFIHR
jgi:hypothetical protein